MLPDRARREPIPVCRFGCVSYGKGRIFARVFAITALDRMVRGQSAARQQVTSKCTRWTSADDGRGQLGCREAKYAQCVAHIDELAEPRS
jgi:hypothetical protein